MPACRNGKKWLFLTVLQWCVWIASPVVADGMDPGLTLSNAEQARRSVGFINHTGTDKSYELIAVAEQGILQDSRPFDIISSKPAELANYYSASVLNVSPFKFQWLRDASGGAVASLEADSITRPYFYRNQHRAISNPRSVANRDLSRLIYRTLPADYRNADLPQLLNAFDDHVHLAFFEHDSKTRTVSYIPGLKGLTYSARLKSDGPDYNHPFNFPSGATGNTTLRASLGSRIVTSILWSEDSNADGVREQYLLEINIGGYSSNPKWQKKGFCVKDNNSHADVVSGQYMVLGEAALELGAGSSNSLNLRSGQWQNIKIDWGKILSALKTREGTGNCRLKASLDALGNSIGLGFAIEIRGAVRQGLRIANATVNPVDDGAAPGVPANPMQLEQPQDDGVVTVQTNNPATGCKAVVGMGRGFYRFEENTFYVNGSQFDVGERAFCRTSVVPEGMSVKAACGLPVDAIDAGECRSPDLAGAATPTVSSGENKDGTTREGQQPVVSGNTISWPDDGWYQLQTAEALETVCEGTRHCEVPAGRYILVNHSTGQRWDNIAVGSGGYPAEAPFSLGTSAAGEVQIRFKLKHWFQVVSAINYASICEGYNDCIVSSGIYDILDHNTGLRWNDIVIGQ